MAKISCIVIALTILLVGGGYAEAHSFGVMYNLPIPFWMYAFAASATLLLSFLMLGFFVTGQAASHVTHFFGIKFAVPHAVWKILRSLSVALFSLTILTGLLGTENPINNFSMTFFWIGVVLGLTYLTALLGNIYEFINPWKVLCDLVEGLYPSAFQGCVEYPTSLAYYPAFVLYMGFIWLELFGHTTPRSLALVLIGYTALNFAAAACFGAKAWFCYGEFLAVFFHLVGKVAPIAYTEGSTITARLRWPFMGLIEEDAKHPSILLFVIFMLSSTAFDGIHETLPWVQLFWKYVYPVLTWAIDQPYAFFVQMYYDWQWSMLWLSPFLYLGIYLLFISMMAGREWPLRNRALLFGYSLIPIALVYNVSHYFTLLFTEAPRLLPLISDPFGVGWNVFGTARLAQDPIVPLARFVWHTQVGLILFGHVVSVYLGHLQALRAFPKRRNAFWSQVPMLILMIAFTTAGFWILSLPIGAGQIRDPDPNGAMLSPVQPVVSEVACILEGGGSYGTRIALPKHDSDKSGDDNGKISILRPLLRKGSSRA